MNGLAAYGDAAYSAGKAAMISLTRSIAMEYGRYGIRANIVCPGTVRTPIWTERASKNPEILAQLARWYPLRRIVEPIEVVRAVAFLASDAASGITRRGAAGRLRADGREPRDGERVDAGGFVDAVGPVSPFGLEPRRNAARPRRRRLRRGRGQHPQHRASNIISPACHRFSFRRSTSRSSSSISSP